MAGEAPKYGYSELSVDYGDMNPYTDTDVSMEGSPSSEEASSTKKYTEPRIHGSFPNPRDSNGHKINHKDPHAQ